MDSLLLMYNYYIHGLQYQHTRRYKRQGSNCGTCMILHFTYLGTIIDSRLNFDTNCVKIQYAVFSMQYAERVISVCCACRNCPPFTLKR